MSMETAQTFTPLLLRWFIRPERGGNTSARNICPIFTHARVFIYTRASKRVWGGWHGKRTAYNKLCVSIALACTLYGITCTQSVAPSDLWLVLYRVIIVIIVKRDGDNGGKVFADTVYVIKFPIYRTYCKICSPFPRRSFRPYTKHGQMARSLGPVINGSRFRFSILAQTVRVCRFDNLPFFFVLAIHAEGMGRVSASTHPYCNGTLNNLYTVAPPKSDHRTWAISFYRYGARIIITS